MDPRFIFGQDYPLDIGLPLHGRIPSRPWIQPNELPERQGFPPTLKEPLLEDEGLRV